MSKHDVSGRTEPQRSSTIKYMKAEVPQVEPPAYSGKRYEVMAPDTLDLQEMAALGINGLTGPTDPEADYEIYWRAAFNTGPRPVMWHSDVADMGCLGQFLESLPLLRLVSGSALNEHVEKRWLETTRQMQGPDGLLYISRKGRPWSVWNYSDYSPLCLGKEPPGDHYACPYFAGRVLGAMTVYLLLTGDPEWKSIGKKLVDGLKTLAVVDGETIHLPLTDSPEAIGDRPSALAHAWCIQGLANYARHTGYEPALDLAGKLAHWVIEESDYIGSDGRFLQEYPNRPYVHFYCHTAVLSSLLDYGIAAGDEETIDFVHRGFTYGMTQGECLLGYFPEWLNAPFTAPSEICEVSEMIAMAVKLSKHGIADYWDMAERWVRNLFCEAQVKGAYQNKLYWLAARIPSTEVAPMEIPPYHSTDRVVERNTGAFVSTLGPNDLLPGGFLYMGSYLDGIAHCCTGNATRSIYYVWENVIAHDAGKLRVNLALNRGSRWADVNSHLPYAGQIDVSVKEPVELSVRIPEWVNQEQVTCTVNGEAQKVTWDGRYARVGKVKEKDVVTLSFPISERCEHISIEKRSYRIVLRGNTCVAIDPPGVNVPLFQRDHYRSDTTRWHKVTRFVGKNEIEW